MNSLYTIEQGIPAPRGRKSSPCAPITLAATFRLMEPGDSVWLPEERRPQVGASMACAGHQNGKKFIRRTEGNGLRVWRIE